MQQLWWHRLGARDVSSHLLQLRGRGVLAENQGLFSFSQPCPKCGGTGMRVETPCPTCQGSGMERRARKVKVRIPAGVDDGQRIRLKGRGGIGPNGGPPGDLYVVVRVGQHDVFGRSGKDLTLRLPITFAEAALGATVKVPTLGAPVSLRIPPGPGRVAPSGYGATAYPRPAVPATSWSR